MVVGVRFRWVEPRLGGFLFLLFLLLGALNAKLLHFVAIRFVTEGLDGILLGQLGIGASKGDLLGAGLLALLNLDLGVFGNTIQLLERRTDVLLATGSSDAGHTHNVSRGLSFRFLFSDGGGQAKCHRDRSNE